jgi:hypothetical protein
MFCLAAVRRAAAAFGLLTADIGPWLPFQIVAGEEIAG